MSLNTKIFVICTMLLFVCYLLTLALYEIKRYNKEVEEVQCCLDSITEHLTFICTEIPDKGSMIIVKMSGIKKGDIPGRKFLYLVSDIMKNDDSTAHYYRVDPEEFVYYTMTAISMNEIHDKKVRQYYLLLKPERPSFILAPRIWISGQIEKIYHVEKDQNIS